MMMGMSLCNFKLVSAYVKAKKHKLRLAHIMFSLCTLPVSLLGCSRKVRASVRDWIMLSFSSKG